jgi:hypothetical protein
MPLHASPCRAKDYADMMQRLEEIKKATPQNLYPRLLFFRISIPATGFLSALPAANRSIWSAHLLIT